MVSRRFIRAPVSLSQLRELNVGTSNVLASAPFLSQFLILQYQANRSYECVDNTAWQILSDLLESSQVGLKSGRQLGKRLPGEVIIRNLFCIFFRLYKGDIGPERNNEDRQLSRLHASNSADAAF